MTITTADFQAMTPTPYSQARGRLQTGDILLFSSTGPFSLVIEHFTESLWSHVGMVWRVGDTTLDRVLVLESLENLGIRAVSASNRINGAGDAKAYDGHLLVARHRLLPNPLTPAQVTELTRFGVDHLGYPYNPVELVRIATRIALGLANVQVPGHLEPSNSYICSEFVARCYEAVGIDLAPNAEGFMAPADVAADQNIVPIMALCPDPS